MMKKKYLRVVFVGCTSFSKKILDVALSIKNTQIVGAVTSTKTFDISYSEKPVKNYKHYDLKNYLKKNDIPFEIMRSKVKNNSLLQKFKVWKPDIFLVAGWYYMIPSKWRTVAPFYGLHASLLPNYAGGAPLVWALLNNEHKTGITLFKLQDGVDDGPIVGQEEVIIDNSETIKTLYKKIEKKGEILVKRYLPKFFYNSIELIEQDKSKRKVYPQRSPKDGKISWENNSSNIERFIRAQTKPYPGAYTMFKGKPLIIWKAEINNNRYNSKCGQLSFNGENYIIGCKLGSITLIKINYNGKDYTKCELKFVFNFKSYNF